MSTYNNTGFVLKNDVYARGTSVSRDGVLQDTKRCNVCHQALDAKDLVYYVFSARGTQAAQSRYIHTECEVKCRIEPHNNNRSVCRICNSGLGLDGCFKLPSRNIYYHQSCLSKTPSEAVSVEDLDEKLQKRAEGRLKRGRLFYSVKVLPYKGLDLVRETYCGSGTDEISITINPLDGRLKEVKYNYGARLFSCGHWITKTEEDFYKAERYLLDGDSYDTHSLSREQRQELTRGIKEVLCDLQKHYDRRGFPIGERLDADFQLRFLLEHGTSIDGVVSEAKR